MNPLSDRIAAILELDPAAPALEFERRWYTWADLAQTAADVDRALRAAGAEAGAPVGVLLRNRPVPVGLVLGVLRAEACLVTINPTLGADRVRADLERLDLVVLAGERPDVETHVGDELAGRTVVLTLDDLGSAPEPAPPSTHAAPPPSPGVAVRMLTSGTTGPPRRIDLTY